MSISSVIKLGVKRLEHAKNLPLPAYETAGAAGFDLRAALDQESSVTLCPGARMLVPTGLILDIPLHYEIQIRPRSGLALKHGITCLNTPGTIDSDYRGEVKILLINHGEEPFIIEHGMRIAQAIISYAPQAIIYETDTVTETVRASKGYGSTGVK